MSSWTLRPMTAEQLVNHPDFQLQMDMLYARLAKKGPVEWNTFRSMVFMTEDVGGLMVFPQDDVPGPAGLMDPSFVVYEMSDTQGDQHVWPDEWAQTEIEAELRPWFDEKTEVQRMCEWMSKHEGDDDG